MPAPDLRRSRAAVASRRTRALRFALTGTASALAVVAFAPVAAQARQASPGPNESGIVDINTELGLQQAAAAGTGLVLTSSGEVLTNNHVIRGETTVRVVEPASGRSFAATVVGYSVANDVAVLQLKGASGLETVTPGDSSKLAVGAAVTAVGNAGGVGGSPSVTTGKVLALHRAITVSDDQGGNERLSGLIATDASLQPGDSGGPLLDSSGAVVGMDTAASSSFEFQPGASKGYAIPIDTALAIASQIEAHRASASVHIGATPFMGVDVQSTSDGFGPQPAAGGAGALVVGIVGSSPAARAGLTEGDVITSLAGKKILTYTAITSVLLGYSPGMMVAIGWTDPLGTAHSGQLRLSSGPPQ